MKPSYPLKFNTMKRNTHLLKKPSGLKSLFLMVCLLLITIPAFSQTKTVTGTVTDGAGETLIGVSIMVEGAENGVVTDLHGKYTLSNVPENGILIVSYLGMLPQNIKVNGRAVINVTLKEDSQQLEEFVVIGYGSAKVKDLTAPITVVKGEALASVPSTSPMTALQGKVAGVNVINNGAPGEGPIVQIRGVGSFSDSKPLFVVDGMFYDNINFLNNADIQEMSILKDASAAAIYGVRAANGVVLITTKKGSRNQKARISYDGYIGIQKAANVLELANAKEYATMLLEGNYNAYQAHFKQSIDKYVPQEVHRVTVVAGQVATVNFNNVLKRGNLQVIKSSEDNLVEGVKFHLYGTSLAGIAVDEYAVTDKNGVATFKDVLISGSTPYTLEEVDTAIRYVVPEKQTAPIQWKGVTNRDFTNILKKFSVTVTKSDREEGTAQGDAKLSGAVYGIYKGDTLVDKYVTDSDGQFTTKEYVCDSDWTIREITPSEGYLLDKTIHKVGAEPKLFTIEHNLVANDVTEQVMKGNIAIIKHTDDGETKIETPENGAEFEVYLKSSGSFEKADKDERDTIVCDENGFAQTKDMPYGVYTVHQTKGWEGREFMKDFDVFISQDGQTYRYLINNANFESYIKVVKVDAETGKTIPYAGAGFQIYDPDGNKVSMTFTYPTPTTIDTFYTDADGQLVTPEKLDYGKGYSLVEVQAPYGYVLDSTPVSFDVTEENSTQEGGITLIKVDKPNMAQKGTISVEKTGEVFFGVNVSGEEDEDVIYQPVYKVKGLAGAVYEITADEDVITPDGTLRYHKGDVVDTVTTDEDGTAKSKELYLGKYNVVETKAPTGMVINKEKHSVELTYAGQDVAVTETATSFVNERQKVKISLEKILEQDETFGIGKNDEIKNISFGLYAKEDVVSSSGTVIPADGLIEIITLDENGAATANTDLPFGSYYVKEIATDEHYILSDTQYPFTFEYAGQDTETVEIKVNDGKLIENKLIYGSVSGKKIDENGEALGGALIGIFKADETEFTKEHAIMTATSEKDGSFSFAKVPYGKWIVREIEAPEGFVLDDTSYEVNIGENEQVIEVEITDEYIHGNIELTKVDADYPDNKLTGATFEVYKDVNGDGKLDDGDELIGNLEETATGIYEMKELLYGKYLVRETKAPEGFVLDKGVYSVFIEKDETTYKVENKAGVGFINEAMKGNLKIKKTSSDGKVEGFTFRVTGVNGYDSTFTTDKNGEISVDGLRIGEYTVSEVSDNVSAGYILPADKKVTVKVGETVEIEMHNELRDTPKTGDDRKTSLWVALAGASALGIVATVVASKRKKKKEGNE